MTDRRYRNSLDEVMRREHKAETLRRVAQDLGDRAESVAENYPDGPTPETTAVAKELYRLAETYRNVAQLVGGGEFDYAGY